MAVDEGGLMEMGADFGHGDYRDNGGKCQPLPTPACMPQAAFSGASDSGG